MKKNKKLLALSLLGIATTLTFSTNFIAKTVNVQSEYSSSESEETLKNDVSTEDNYMWPTHSTNITNHYSSSNNGITISGNRGDIVMSIDSGIVTQAGWINNGNGYSVTIDHNNGLTSTYSHLEDISEVYVGDEVTKGETIGYLGVTGLAEGPVLGFNIEKNGNSIDPETYTYNTYN